MLGSAFLENISDKNDNGIRPLLLIYPVIGKQKMIHQKNYR